MSRDDLVLLAVKRLESVAEKLIAVAAHFEPKRRGKRHTEEQRLRDENLRLRVEKKSLQIQLKEAHKFLRINP